MKAENIIIKKRYILVFEDLTGERNYTVSKSAWKDHYIVVIQDVTDEYDPMVLCLTANQILKSYGFNIEKYLK